MGNLLTGAAIVFKALEEQGVDTIFGYPGGAVLPIYDELKNHPSLKHILVRHEQGAGHAAEGYARSTGKPGVVFVTSGPGATNVVTALTDAFMDSVPLVCISGQVPTHLIGTDAFQECDTTGITRPCTKHNWLVKNIKDLSKTIHKAFEVATTGRPGPVLVDIPKDVQMAIVEQTFDATAHLKNKVKLPLADITKALDLLAAAKQPILYVGGGVGMANAIEEVRSFAQETGIPSVSTLKGLGALDANDENYLGMLGMHGTKAANLAVHDCDLLIAVGARFDDRVTGKLDQFAPGAKVIHFDIDTVEINKRRVADAPILGDLKENLPLLISVSILFRPLIIFLPLFLLIIFCLTNI